MEFLVEFELSIPDDIAESEVKEREDAEAAAAATLAREGHLVRVWRARAARGDAKVLCLYRADNLQELHDLLAALPLYRWMSVEVTTLEQHPNDPLAN
jgi:muconolactone D-isomerase